MKPDVIVVGCGFAGAVVARQLAEKFNKNVVILEKREHIAGNMYECEDTNGVRIHKYGPHIFHTNSNAVYEYLKQFSEFYKYQHEVKGKIDGKLVPIPFNFKSIDTLFTEHEAKNIKDKLIEKFPNSHKVSIYDLLHDEDVVIKSFGTFVYQKVFVNYTAKQWNQPIEKVDTSVINRVPVMLNYDEKYFQDSYQYMPKDGFTKLFENMLNHENIQVKLCCNAKSVIKLDYNYRTIYYDNQPFNGTVVYTGALDELLDYKFGYLPYRSLNLAFEQYPVTEFQPAAVVNYPNEEDFTRITEFKYLTKQKLENATTILKEYPLTYDPFGKASSDPYYPISNEQNNTLYKKYEQEAVQCGNLFLCGRLAEYKYYNMDMVVEKALELSEIIGQKYNL